MMRRILMVLAMVPALAQAAELSVGTFEVSGSSNLGFSSGSTKVEAGGVTDTTDTTSYALSTSGLYYLAPNVGVGLNLVYDHTEDTTAGTTTGTSTFLLGPAAGIAFPLQEKLYFAAQGYLGYASATVTQTGSPDVSGSGWGLGLGAGLKYFVVKSFSIDAGLGYRYQKLTIDLPFGGTQDVTTSGFGLNVGFAAYFGGK